MSNDLLQFKRGDTIPISGVITVLDNGVDTSAALNYSLWRVTCQVEDAAGLLFHAVVFAPMTGPLFYGEVPSAVTETAPVGARYVFDIRIRDETGFVRSTRTFSMSALPAVSETP